MGNRQCGHCISCYDDQEYRHVESLDAHTQPIINNDEILVVEMPEVGTEKREEHGWENNFVDYQLKERFLSKETPESILLYPKFTEHRSDSLSEPTVSLEQHSTTLAQIATLDISENIQQHFSMTFSSEKYYKSMSSESMGRETRTETCLMRRLGSSCERDDVNDEPST